MNEMKARAASAVYKNTIHMQPLTAIITCVHVSGGIFKPIILLFQQIALVTGDI